MTIPTGSKYPKSFDSPSQLFTVYDSLKVTLAQDYNPGDVAIFVEEDTGKFPDNGIITLIDQCADHEERSVSLYYNKKSSNMFLDVELTNNNIDCFKPKKLTKVVMQLRAEHHNNIKDAIISIEQFLGTIKQEDNEPFGPTLFGRINFLKKVLYSPKAWFEADKTTGLAPFTVKFTSRSSGITDYVNYQWNLGDGTIIQGNDNFVEKTYYRPGNYTVSLTIENDYGTDTAIIENMIKVRAEAPEEAIIDFLPQENQLLIPGEIPVIRTPVNQIVSIQIPKGKNPATPGINYNGERLDDNNKPIDIVTTYTWSLMDELSHGNSSETKAAYFIGGLHDLTLRVDTQFGSYRITNYENRIDVVEMRNLWLWNLSKNNINAHEMGINSETFKARHTVSYLVTANDNFLKTQKEKKEFRRNCGFSPRYSEKSSGMHDGTCMLFWASGRNKNEPITSESIYFTEYNGFTDVYSNTFKGINRPWNWVALCSSDDIYFVLGGNNFEPLPAMSPTNINKSIFNLTTLESRESVIDNFINGAQEVKYNPAVFDEEGQPLNGHFSVYRTCWRGYTGFILRNGGIGEHYSLKNFYKTDGTLGTPFESLVKLADVPGGGIAEGQLATLSNGVYLFNNSDVALVYKEETNTWEATSGGNPGMFRGLQDTKTIGYDNETNSLLVATDNDQKAFLSFDYSNHAFIKFNESDFTYSTMGTRPAGEQWQIGVY